MAKPLPAPFDKKQVVAENRRARFDYFVEDRVEAGIALTGTEVKSLRHGEGSIAESYAAVEGEEGWLDLGTVGQRLFSLVPDFDSRTYGFGKLSDLVRKTGAFEIDRPEGNRGMRVRVKPERADRKKKQD